MGLTSAAHNGLFNLHTIKKQKQWTMNKKSEPEFTMFNYMKKEESKIGGPGLCLFFQENLENGQHLFAHTLPDEIPTA